MALLVFSLSFVTGAKAEQQDWSEYADTFRIEEKEGEVVLIKYIGNQTAVYIPDGVTVIGANAFSQGSYTIQEVYIPDSVTKLEDGVFKYLGKVKSLYIPDSVVSIGEYVFSDCAALTDIHLSENLEVIPKGAFNNCKSLENLVIPDSVVEIGIEAFDLCIALKNVTLSKSLEKIGDRAFLLTSGLRYLQLPDSLKTIGSSAFMNSGIVFLEVPNSVTEIGAAAFGNCNNLEKLVLPAGVSLGNTVTFRSPVKVLCIKGEVENVTQGFNLSEMDSNLVLYTDAAETSELVQYFKGSAFKVEPISNMPDSYPTCKLNGYSASLSDVINMQIYFDVSEETVNKKYYYVRMNVPGVGTYNAYLGDLYEEDSLTGEKLYYINCTLPAKYIGNDIELQIINCENKPCGFPYVYSVRTYCENLLDSQYISDYEKNVARALIGYGYYSWEYFIGADSEQENPWEHVLVAPLSSEQEVLKKLSDVPDMVIIGKDYVIDKVEGVSLILESALRMRVYVSCQEPSYLQNYATLAGTGNLGYQEKAGISIADLAKEQHYSIGGYSITVSPLYYLKSAIGRGAENNEKLMNLCIALYDYYDAVQTEEDDDVSEMQFEGSIWEEFSLSGDAKDVVVTDRYSYVETENCVLLFDKDTKIPGDFAIVVEDIISEIEKKIGLSHKVPGYVNADDNSINLYFGENASDNVTFGGDKILILFSNDREDIGLVSCATDGACVIVMYEMMSDELWNSIPGYYNNSWRRQDYVTYSEIAHELTHAITLRNAYMNSILTEGIATYMQSYIPNVLLTKGYKSVVEEEFDDYPISVVVTADNAEEVFTEDFCELTTAQRGSEYTLGRWIFEYLFQNFGDSALCDYMDELHAMNIEPEYDENWNLSVSTRQQYTVAMKSVFGNDFFDKFGAWYEINFDGVVDLPDDHQYQPGELTLQELMEAFAETPEGGTYELTQPAYIPKNRYFEIPSGITFCIGEGGKLTFGSEFASMSIRGDFVIPDGDWYELTLSEGVEIFIESDATVYMDGMEFQSGCDTEYNALITLGGLKPLLLLQTSMLVTGGDDMLQHLKEAYDVWFLDECVLKLNGEVYDSMRYFAE